MALLYHTSAILQQKRTESVSPFRYIDKIYFLIKILKPCRKVISIVSQISTHEVISARSNKKLEEELANELGELEFLKEEKEKIGSPDVLGETIKSTSVCGLGQTAPNPVLSTIKYFREEYEAHIKDKKCPAGQCKALTSLYVDENICKQCGICKKNCPVDAIKGEPRQGAYEIISDKCIKCGTCIDKCPFKAIKYK